MLRFFSGRKLRKERVLRKCAAMRAAKERKRLASLTLRGAGEVGGDRLVARTLEARVTVERPGRCREAIEVWAEPKGEGEWRRWVTVNGVRCRWIRSLGAALRAVVRDCGARNAECGLKTGGERTR